MLNSLEQEVGDLCNSFFEGKAGIRMLEAGCGSASHVRFTPSVDAVGIDISREQLDRNTTVREKILGDIQMYPLPRNEFDVVVCWWVLEHLSRPNDALINLLGSVKPGGLMVLVFPNLLSFKGIITKITPFWFHKVYYWFMGWKSHPFPTYLRKAILPNNVIRLSNVNGFSPVYFKLTESNTVIKRVRTCSRLTGLAFSAVVSTLQSVSFGKLDSLLLDCCAMVLLKNRSNSTT